MTMTERPAVKAAGTFEDKNAKAQGAKPRPKGPALRKVLDLSKDQFRKVNWYYPGGREAFPTKPRLWTVDACFPYAEGGMLLADIVMLEHKFLEAKEKAKYFKEKNIKYVAVLQSGVILNFEDEELNEKNFINYGQK